MDTSIQSSEPLTVTPDPQSTQAIPASLLEQTSTDATNADLLQSLETIVEQGRFESYKSSKQLRLAEEQKKFRNKLITVIILLLFVIFLKYLCMVVHIRDKYEYSIYWLKKVPSQYYDKASPFFTAMCAEYPNFTTLFRSTFTSSNLPKAIMYAFQTEPCHTYLTSEIDAQRTCGYKMIENMCYYVDFYDPYATPKDIICFGVDSTLSCTGLQYEAEYDPYNLAYPDYCKETCETPYIMSQSEKNLNAVTEGVFFGSVAVGMPPPGGIYAALICGAVGFGLSFASDGNLQKKQKEACEAKRKYCQGGSSYQC